MLYLILYTKKDRLRIVLILVMLFVSSTITAQTVTNGNFTSGGTGWGCSPETNPESVYGGSGSNRVAEVDAAAALCQTIPGFTIGSLYQITFLCSRRTSCGPATQTLDFNIDGGALPTQSISRTGVFNFTTEIFNFTATATSHTIDFDGTSAGTCGLIIDDIVISLVSALPIELLNFNAFPINNEIVQLSWKTASEMNNDYFTIERSKNGNSWEEIVTLDGAGNSSSLLSYSTNDNHPYMGISYYRLKQTDFDAQFEYSDIRSLNIERLGNSQTEMYPNPVNNQITIHANPSDLKEITIYNALGQDVTLLARKIEKEDGKLVLDFSNLGSGIYYIKTKTTTKKVHKL